MSVPMAKTGKRRRHLGIDETGGGYVDVFGEDGKLIGFSIDEYGGRVDAYGKDGGIVGGARYQ